MPSPGPRLRDADQLQQFDGALAGLRAADIGVVHLDRFGDLVADGVHGGQRRHRVLEYGADRLAADLDIA